MLASVLVVLRASWLRVFATFVFATQFVVADAWMRGGHAWLDRPRTAVSLVESVVLWLVVAAFATTRARRIAASLASATLLVVQALVFRYYHAPLDVQVAESALYAWRDVSPVLVRAAPVVVASVTIVALVENALLAAAARPRHARRVLNALALCGLFGPPLRHATPDLRGLHALAALRPDPPKPVASRAALALPPLHSDRRTPPDVLFVLTESVRAAEYATSAAPRLRVDLRQMRAVSSYTALSLSALVTGRSQEAPRDEILRAPSVFDYAHAARYDVGYWSAQSAEVFETDEVRAAARRFVTVETLLGRVPADDSKEPLDAMIVERFTRDLRAPAMGSDRGQPLFAMLHLMGTHAPYHVDPADAPYAPYDHVVTWSGMPKLLNAYKNAIHHQDKILRGAVEAFVERAGDRPWLVVFTSDHGEAFGEHGAIHHGQNLYDEQVHVPAWIAWGNGALTDGEAVALSEHERRHVTHLDVLPTILDAMGLGENFALAAYTKPLRGRSLLRPYAARGIIPVTNCTAMFKCPLNTWGVYEDDHKLVAHLWDGGWECLVTDGAERPADEADPTCARLREASRRHFPVLPNGTPNR